jgi:predicted molibdopterin-dependent oxidoreductase YjgC
VAYVTPKVADSVNEATLCVRGHYGNDYLHHPDRLTAPLIRKDGGLQLVSWDDALGLVVQKLREIVDRSDGGAVGFLGSTQCTNEENYLLQKIARFAVGSPHVDNDARLQCISSLVGLREVLGTGGATNPMKDLASAQVIFVVGAQPTESHPVASYHIKRSVRFGDARLIYANCVQDELSLMADLPLRIQPGSELALIMGIIRVLMDEGLWRKDLVGDDPDGWEVLKAAVDAFPLSVVERFTGVNREQMVEVARVLSSTRRCALVFGGGISQSPGAVTKIKALANLAILLGCLGVHGGGIYPLDKAANTQGACDMGTLPEWLPGYRRATDQKARTVVGRAWGKNPPGGAGWSIGEMFEAIGRGELRALYVMGENPVAMLPREAWEKLEQLEFLVVQDLFLSETAEMADVILPGAGFAEKEGTFTSLERRIQLLRPALKPPGEARPDWWILSEIFDRLEDTGGYESPAEIMQEIASVIPAYAGVQYSRIERGSLFIPCPDTKSPGEALLHGDRTGNMRLTWDPNPVESTVLGGDTEFPWVAIRGDTHLHFSGGTRSKRSARLCNMCPECRVQLHPEDMEKAGVTEGEMVCVRSHTGEHRARVEGKEHIPTGVAWVIGGPDGGTMGQLTAWQWDPVTKMPQLFTASVTIQRIEGEK